MKYTILFTIIIALILLYLVFGHNGILKYREMVLIKENYENMIKEIDSKVKVMESELNAVKKDKEYLENLIRRELGMQKSEEDLYIIEKE